MKIILFIFICFVSLNSWSNKLHIIKNSGSFLYIKGQVLINDKKADLKSLIWEKNRIKTGPSSLAVFKLPDRSKIKLSENSVILIEKLYNKEDSTRLNISHGEAFFTVLKEKIVSKKDKFIVKNKFTSMGVRGTKFFVSSAVNKKDDLWMCVNEGLVAIQSLQDKAETLVKAGEGIVSNRKQGTSKPRPLPWTKNLNWNMDPKYGDLENKVKIEEAYFDLLNQDYD